MLPAGAHIYRKLEELIRAQYRLRNYSEVISPNMFHSDLFNVSGHVDKYADDMFFLDVDGQQHALKPMNCPGHALMFKQLMPSYRQLPLRLAEFGVCHRNEKSGALSGLRRVRRFEQDDGHIFCLPDQIQSEVADVLDFVRLVYAKLGLDYSLELSSRPEKYIGEIEVWDEAEDQLKAALDLFAPGRWNIDKGGGAFYGPKIDIKIQAAGGKALQLASIQLDFQLPQRFDLRVQQPAKGPHWCLHADCLLEDEPFPSADALASHAVEMQHGGYEKPKGSWARPVMIHRAVLGSLERMLSVLLERWGANWPFFLSPRQVLILPKDPANAAHVAQAERVSSQIRVAGFSVAIDHSQQSLNSRLVMADGRHDDRGMHAKAKVVLIIGNREIERDDVAARIDCKPQPAMKMDAFLSILHDLEQASQGSVQI